MIKITLNGEAYSIEEGTTFAALLEGLNISTVGVAVERNREIVPKSTHDIALLEDGDIVEVVRMTGGG
ncbi:MAG: sulfur carrier protein ThiS [Deltaproteobacteria bacterium]|nr:sulfur carrier protein ThiS [Deltaproteobacteria bacterium]